MDAYLCRLLDKRVHRQQPPCWHGSDWQAAVERVVVTVEVTGRSAEHLARDLELTDRVALVVG